MTSGQSPRVANSSEEGKAITVDTLGNVYVTGMARSGFPVDDNPIQADGLTISQNMSIGLFVLGWVLIGVFAQMDNR